MAIWQADKKDTLMREEWLEIQGFPKYLVSNFGQVYNMQYRRIKSLGKNQQGVVTAALWRNNVQYIRAVSLLVARAFIERSDNQYANSIIHLDGNKNNCRVDNLAWRTRSFAILYHNQFELKSFYEIQVDTELLETNEKFEDLCTPAMQYGMVYTHIMRSYTFNEEVWPQGYHFRLI